MSAGKVLVVDDEPEVRFVLTEFLESRGYEVTAAESGPQALAMVEEVAPHVVLLDVTMPEMGNFRWLTVCAPGQPDVGIVLMAIPGAPMFDDETVGQITTLMGKGLAGTVFFTTEDAEAHREEWDSLRPCMFAGLPSLVRRRLSSWGRGAGGGGASDGRPRFPGGSRRCSLADGVDADRRKLHHHTTWEAARPLVLVIPNPVESMPVRQPEATSDTRSVHGWPRACQPA